MGPATVPFVAAAGPAALPTWNNQPNAETELYGAARNRAKAVLTNASDVRFLANVSVAGSGSSELQVQY
jgi:hypothetical protein